MRTILLPIDNLLRGRVSKLFPTDVTRPLPIRQLLLLILTFGMLYGAIMGGYGGGRFLQILYSATKVPLLLLATFLLSLPSFFVLGTLLGLRDDLAESLRALLATQAALTIILASFAPFTALWYLSVADYSAAILFNALMFGLASIAAQLLLRRFYAPLITANPRHRILLRIWIVIYAFVGIQMGWLLRPFIGDPALPTHFFRHDAWGNAYEVILRMIWHLVARSASP